MQFSEGFLSRHPGIKQAVETGEIEGVPFTFVEGPIQPGDTYIAERNQGLKLLTCESVNLEGGWIHPVERAYPYDLGECFKIELTV